MLTVVIFVGKRVSLGLFHGPMDGRRFLVGREGTEKVSQENLAKDNLSENYDNAGKDVKKE